MALGGNAGARLAARLKLPVSAATVLRLVRAKRANADTGGEFLGTEPTDMGFLL
jgi:hypothetical protein